MIKKLPFLSCLLLISVLGFSQKLYIAENGATQIQRSNTDGSSLQLISSAGQVGAILDIAVDEARNRVFWVQNDASNSKIMRADLIAIGGTVQLGNVVDFVSVSSTFQFEGLAINKSAREIYLTTRGSPGSIYRVSLDATPPITILPVATILSLFASYGIDFDHINDKFFFVNQATFRQIQSANANGSGQGIVGSTTGEISDGSFGTIHDVVVDPVAGKLYCSTVITGVGQIIQANLDGTNPIPIVTSLPNTIKGLALDTKNGFIYWGTGSTAVGSAKLDGSGATNIITGLNTVNYIAPDFSTTAPPKLYWTEGSLQEIHRINTDGTDFERYYFGTSPYPTGIAIDNNTRYVYWADRNQSTIKRGLIGETDFESLEIVLNYPDLLPGISGIDLDPNNTMIYFADAGNNRIQRADYSTAFPLTGTDIELVSNPFGLDLDLVNGKVYYTANDLAGSNTGTLYRANLDGSGAPEVLIAQPSPGASPQRFMHDVKIDPNSGTVYWVFTEADGPATIYKADISNVSGTATSLIPATSGEVRGIEIDPATNKIWWVCRGISSTAPPAIMQANLSDGSGITPLSQAAFFPPNGNFIVLDKGCVQPFAADLSLNAPLGQTVVADPIASSTFSSSDVIQVSITQNPAKGTASVAADGKVSFTPNSGTVGADVITYQICNQCNLCDQAAINITIPNEPPVITPPANIQVVIGGVAVIPLSALLFDPNNNLDISTLSVVSPPTSGASASFNNNSELVVDYTGLGFSGTDNLTIEVCDLLGVCSTTVITIIVSNSTSGSLIVHNGISPNGDGLNDYFNIENIEMLEPGNNVTIYNRWGDKVFEIDNYDNANPDKRFNGDSDKGKALSSGVYFYKIKFTSGSDDLEGYLTLKR